MNYRGSTSCFVLLLISCHSASSIQCYKCRFGDLPNSQPYCENPSTESSGRSTDDEKAILEIPSSYWSSIQQSGAGRQQAREVCIAAFGTFNGLKGIFRDTGQGLQEGPTFCALNVNRNFGQVRFIGDLCLCDTDFCNGKNDRNSYGQQVDANNNNGNNNNRPSVNSTGSLMTIGLLSTLLNTGTVLMLLVQKM